MYAHLFKRKDEFGMKREAELAPEAVHGDTV
jgi:hypothetical protein